MSPETTRRLLLAISHFFMVIIVAVLFNFALEVSIPHPVPSRFPMTYLLELYIHGIADPRAERVIAAALPWTLALLIPATLVAFAIGTLLGAWLGRSRNTGRTTAISLPIIIAASIPAFLIGMVLTAIFAVQLHWLPGAAAFTPTLLWEQDRLGTLGDLAIHAVLPMCTIALAGIGLFAVAMRGTVTMQAADDHTIFAESLGLPERTLFWDHLVRPSLLPQVTGLGLVLALVVTGSILVEANFSYPGLGYLLYRATISGDLVMMRSVTFVLIVGLAFTLAVVEFLYPWIDPRIRTAQRR
jgi:peptide/nickel transport system permease protein